MCEMNQSIDFTERENCHATNNKNKTLIERDIKGSMDNLYIIIYIDRSSKIEYY